MYWNSLLVTGIVFHFTFSSWKYWNHTTSELSKENLACLSYPTLPCPALLIPTYRPSVQNIFQDVSYIDKAWGISYKVYFTAHEETQ